MATLRQYGTVNYTNDYDENYYGDDVYDVVGDDGDGFPRGNCAISAPDGALYSKSDTGFKDEELFLKWLESYSQQEAVNVGCCHLK